MQIYDRAKRIITAGVLTGLLILGGCGPSSNAGKPGGGVPEVAVVTIRPQKVVMTTELSGRTAAYLIAEVRPQVGGIIQKRLFTEGANVKAGQVLYRIDAAPYQAVLDNAKAALGRSEANLSAVRLRAERVRELVVDKAVSQQEYDDAAGALKQTEADIQSWKATVETAKINLGYTALKAPISGRIGKSGVTEGALVTAQQPLPLATIQQLNPMYVDVPQSSAEVLRLRGRIEDGRLSHNGHLREKVRLTMEDGAKYPLEGVMQFRDVTVDPTTGSVILRIVFPNPKDVLLPGMFVRAAVEEGINHKALLIPQQAVMRDPKGNPFALLVDGQGKVQQRPLTLDRAIGDQWLVSSGLAAGEQVIVEGVQKARPGATVKAIPYAAGGENKNAAAPPAKTN
ncbi:MAG: efflux RND transporter periplasmic adaptor subunit [Syntrophales bacterium]|nr:efflux RND transporter periplasmic adaptor subunit [Syntrophales bacterium]